MTTITERNVRVFFAASDSSHFQQVDEGGAESEEHFSPETLLPGVYPLHRCCLVTCAERREGRFYISLEKYVNFLRNFPPHFTLWKVIYVYNEVLCIIQKLSRNVLLVVCLKDEYAESLFHSKTSSWTFTTLVTPSLCNEYCYKLFIKACDPLSLSVPPSVRLGE